MLETLHQVRRIESRYFTLSSKTNNVNILPTVLEHVEKRMISVLKSFQNLLKVVTFTTCRKGARRKNVWRDESLDLETLRRPPQCPTTPASSGPYDENAHCFPRKNYSPNF